MENTGAGKPFPVLVYAEFNRHIRSVIRVFSFVHVAGLTDPEDIRNGYLLEMNFRTGDENCWFKTSRSWAFNVKSPENLTEAAMTYISQFYQEFEDAVYGTDELGNGTGVNPDTGKAFYEYCDLDSLARMYLLYYFSNNQDAYVQSTYFYMEDGILHAGPIWDSDQTFGIGWSEPREPDSELMWNYLTEALVKLPEFRDAVMAIYEAEFRPLALRYAEQTVSEYQTLLAASEAMNHRIWPVYYNVSGLKDTFPAGTTYAEIVDRTARWMTARIDYMDYKFQTWGQPEPPPEEPEPQEPPEEPEPTEPEDTPETPDTPDTPETPEAPDTPDLPETPEPEEPVQP